MVNQVISDMDRSNMWQKFRLAIQTVMLPYNSDSVVRHMPLLANASADFGVIEPKRRHLTVNRQPAQLRRNRPQKGIKHEFADIVHQAPQKQLILHRGRHPKVPGHHTPSQSKAKGVFPETECLVWIMFHGLHQDLPSAGSNNQSLYRPETQPLHRIANSSCRDASGIKAGVGELENSGSDGQIATDNGFKVSNA
jgi:hypothetical protein